MTTTHEYETVEGTPPAAHVTHEPRTLKHTATTGDDTDLFMMTEIGDGVFVQWSTCRRCNKRVGEACKCPEGPQEPKYMKPWRDKRFKRELNTRPDPSHTLLDSVLDWVKERGYTVTKKRVAAETVSVSDPSIDPDRESATEEYRELLNSRAGLTDEEAEGLAEAVDPDAFGELGKQLLGEPNSLDDAVRPEKVDAGLDAALAKVREKRNLDDIPDDF